MGNTFVSSLPNIPGFHHPCLSFLWSLSILIPKSILKCSYWLLSRAHSVPIFRRTPAIWSSKLYLCTFLNRSAHGNCSQESSQNPLLFHLAPPVIDLSTPFALPLWSHRTRCHCIVCEFLSEKKSDPILFLVRWMLLQAETLYPMRGIHSFPDYNIAPFLYTAHFPHPALLSLRYRLKFPAALHQLQLLPIIDYIHKRPALGDSKIIFSLFLILQLGAYLKASILPHSFTRFGMPRSRLCSSWNVIYEDGLTPSTLRNFVNSSKNDYHWDGEYVLSSYGPLFSLPCSTPFSSWMIKVLSHGAAMYLLVTVVVSFRSLAVHLTAYNILHNCHILNAR